MWFGQSVMHHGIDAANELNCAAVRAMGAVETKRVMRLLGMPAVAGPADVRLFFDAAIALLIPSFMAFEVAWAPDATQATFHITRCFAHDGVESLGVLDQYRCGIYPRAVRMARHARRRLRGATRRPRLRVGRRRPPPHPHSRLPLDPTHESRR